jgi:hypothetical protein
MGGDYQCSEVENSRFTLPAAYPARWVWAWKQGASSTGPFLYYLLSEWNYSLKLLESIQSYEMILAGEFRYGDSVLIITLPSMTLKT